jgi:hypothetical protein
VLISIASHAFGGPVAGVTQDEIGAECRIKRSKVSESVDALDTAGYLRVRRSRRGNVYHLILDEVLPPAVIPRAGTTTPAGGSIGNPAGGNPYIEVTDSITDKNTPTARAREGFLLDGENEGDDASQSDGADRRQFNLLLPINGSGAQRGTADTADARAPDALFEEFWAEWPTRIGKAPAQKAFRKAIGKASLETMLDGVRSYARNKPADRQWLNPATWLSQERWNDEYEPSGNLGLSKFVTPRGPPPKISKLQ